MDKNLSPEIYRWNLICKLPILSLCLVFGGCGVHQKTVDAIDERGAGLLSVARHSEAQGKSIGWHEAAGLLVNKNPQILRARLQQGKSKKKRKGYWKNYIPGIRGSASIAKSLGDFDDLELSDFNVYAFLNLRLPNPVRVRGELIALSLSDYRSTRSYELTKRRQLVSLYREFWRYEEARLAYEESLSLDAEGDANVNDSDMMSRIRKASESSAQRSRLRKSMDQVSFRINQMLQLSDYKIRPQLDKLPRIDYSKRYRQLESSNGYGRLALQILATDIEGARLRHQRVRLERWPRVGLGASAPQVYSSNSNSEFDVDSVRLFGNFTKGFDFLDERKDRGKQSKKDYEQVKLDAYYRVIKEREMLRYALGGFKQWRFQTVFVCFVKKFWVAAFLDYVG